MQKPDLPRCTGKKNIYFSSICHAMQVQIIIVINNNVATSHMESNNEDGNKVK